MATIYSFVNALKRKNKTIINMRIYFTEILVFSVLLLGAGCKKEQNPVPRVEEDLWFYNIEADAQFAKLTGPYNGVIVTGGYNNNGILIYRLKNENAEDDFVAYDRTCPYEVSNCKLLWKNSDPFYCECSCCKSKYNLIGEYMENGPAEHPPRKFKTEFINGNLHIY